MVPEEDYLYYIVEEIFEDFDDIDGWNDYTLYKVGTPIVLKSRNYNLQEDTVFNRFLKNNCRYATETEIESIYNSFFSHARISEVFPDGTYKVNYFYVPNDDYLEIWENFEFENNCQKANYELAKFIGKLCLTSFIDLSIGCYKGEFFFFTDYFEPKLLRIARKATSKEAAELCNFVKVINITY